MCANCLHGSSVGLAVECTKILEEMVVVQGRRAIDVNKVVVPLTFHCYHFIRGEQTSLEVELTD